MCTVGLALSSPGARDGAVLTAVQLARCLVPAVFSAFGQLDSDSMWLNFTFADRGATWCQLGQGLPWDWSALIQQISSSSLSVQVSFVSTTESNATALQADALMRVPCCFIMHVVWLLSGSSCNTSSIAAEAQSYGASFGSSLLPFQGGCTSGRGGLFVAGIPPDVDICLRTVEELKYLPNPGTGTTVCSSWDVVQRLPGSPPPSPPPPGAPANPDAFAILALGIGWGIAIGIFFPLMCLLARGVCLCSSWLRSRNGAVVLVNDKDSRSLRL